MPSLASRFALCTVLMFLAACSGVPSSSVPGVSGEFNVRAFGARGDGVTLDTTAVNAAIHAATLAGGGTVVFPAGTYACHSIHLQSNVTLYLGAGATLLAAPPSAAESYDPPEPNPYDPYEDFGHSHFHNSLIWGENLANVAIIGPGMIDGSHGLTRGNGSDPTEAGTGILGHPTSRHKATTKATSKPTSKPTSRPAGTFEYPNAQDTLPAGVGNKAIALKLCRNVLLRDFTVRGAGHFAVLATGDERLTIDNITVDTNRDGFDVDSCRNVHISNCIVNSPLDDGICLKSDFALGYNKPCEDVTITNCQVSGFACPTLLDGRRLRGGGTGRIKLGTESNGGFKNIAISNCVFDSCYGLALETVDGGPLENIVVDNITMRHPVNSPIFLRLGARLRGPVESTATGTLTRVNISNIVVYDADPKYASIITGVPGHPVTDVKISNVQIFTKGGAKETRKWATTEPGEKADGYPEPGMFGPTPAYGFYVRHAAGVEFTNVALHTAREDFRPAFVLEDTTGVKLVDIDAQQPTGVPHLIVHSTTDLTVRDFPGAP
jgi:polygalacturonase